MGAMPASWHHLGATLGRSWHHLGLIWGHLGPSWAHLGASWHHLEPSWGDLGISLDSSRATLGPSWASWGQLGVSWVVLRLSCAILRRSRVRCVRFPRANAKGSCLVGLQPGPRCLSRRLPASCRRVAGELPGKSRCIDLGPKPSKRLGRSLKKSKKHHTATSVLLKAINTPLFLLDFS